MTKSAKIVFFGNERLATGVSTDVPVLRSLLDAGYDVCAVVTQHDQQARSRKPRPSEVMTVAAEHDIPVLLPHKMAEIADQLRAFGAEAGVLVAFGKIVPQSIIDLFPHGIINIHPSLLPLHRGPTPIESVMLNGEPETGVSLMALAAKMDAGDVYAQERLSVPAGISKQALASALLELGRDMLLKHLSTILDGGPLAGQPQDDTHATYDSLITKGSSWLNTQLPAIELERQIRAYANWPRSRAAIGGHDLIITAAHVAATPDDGPALETSEGYLIIDELILPGKKPMSGRDFARGYLRD